MSMDLVFKIADSESEMEQIHSLNYETFVEEIPQHERNADRRLVDKFHHENTYLICLDSGELLGMMAVRDKRPFSLDVKLQDLDSYLPESRSICEIRLLSIRQDRRGRKVLKGLFQLFAELARDRDYDLGIISANPKQEKLYNRLGFKPFAHVVGSPGAEYQPMYFTWQSSSRFRKETKVLTSEFKNIHE
ncbi:MAG: GNAT family N-acetyltransferase [Proteobacteria bacterium]|nr:GNAT family N-acetyltransferase [Pseudomonadota bacterium]